MLPQSAFCIEINKNKKYRWNEDSLKGRIFRKDFFFIKNIFILHCYKGKDHKLQPHVAYYQATYIYIRFASKRVIKWIMIT